jgi:multiple sugar transport system substrate-binding protein
MKKTIIFILLCACVIPLAFSGGGSDRKTAGGPERIEFWYGLGGSLGEAMEANIKDFNASQNEVVVTGVQQSSYDETSRQVQAAVAARQVPATALLNWGNLNTFQSRGIVEKLDGYIAADPGFNKSDIVPSFLAYCLSEKNEVMGLPVWGTTQIMYYRMDAFRNAGIDPSEALKTWQSLAAASAKMAKKTNGETVFFGWEPMSGAANMVDMAYSNGGRILSADQKTVLIDSPEWTESWEEMRKWLHEDKIMGIHYGGDGWEYWYKTIDDVMQNRAAGYIGSSGDQGDLDFSIVAAHIQPGYGSHPPKPYADALTTAILAGASQAQKDAGFKWLRYLCSAPVTARFAMRTGYIPVRSSCVETPEFKAYVAEHPQALVPLKQAEIARESFLDITGGKINTAIDDACNLVQIENVPAAQALRQAKVAAQAALDEYWANK